MSFAVAADAYDRFMGRYSVPLAAPFADFAGVAAGQQALDVGCGPGALLAELVRRLGPSAVSAVDPSGGVGAMETRHPEVDVRLAPGGGAAVRGRCLRRDRGAARRPLHAGPGRRPTRDGPRHAGGRHRRGLRLGSRRRDGPLSPFWEVVRALDGEVEDESELPGARQGHLAGSSTRPNSARSRTATSRSPWSTATFEDWWEPYTLGVGRLERTSRASPQSTERGCASAAARLSPPPRSSSARGPGRRAGVPGSPVLRRGSTHVSPVTCGVVRRGRPASREGTRPVQASSCCMRVSPPGSAAERLDEEAREGPRTVRRVRDHGVRRRSGSCTVGTRLRRPSPPVRRGRPWGGARSRARSGATGLRLAPRPGHLGDAVERHDPPREESAPERPNVCRGRCSPC